MSPIQRTITMVSVYHCPSPTSSPLVRREELPQAALLFTGDHSDFMAPVTIDPCDDAEEWKSWIYPEYIVPELQVELDFLPQALAPIDQAALDVLSVDHNIYPVEFVDAEGGIRVDDSFPLSDDRVVGTLLVTAEPLLSPENVSDSAPCGDVVTARIPLVEGNLNLGEPQDLPKPSKLDPKPPITRDILGPSLSHGTESSPVPSTTTGVVRGPKSSRAARHSGAVGAQPQRRSSRVAAMTVTAMTMTTDVPPVQHKHVCTHEGCNRSFPGSYEFGRHQRTHLPPSLFCGVCKCAVKGDRPDALRRHQRETERCKTLQRRFTDERLQELGCITREERRMSLAPEDWLD